MAAGISDLLQKKVEEATRQMAQNFETQLWSASPHSHTHSYSYSPTWFTTTGTGGWNPDADASFDVYARAMIGDQKKIKKEDKMSTVAAVRAEREKVRIERALDEYEESWMCKGGYEAGTTIRFDWSPDDSDKTYNYAAIFAGDSKWYVTGERSPQGLTTTRFVDWLVERKINVGDIFYNQAPADG